MRIASKIVNLDLQSGVGTDEGAGSVLDYDDWQLRAIAVLARARPELDVEEVRMIAAVVESERGPSEPCRRVNVEPDLGDGDTVGLLITSGCNSNQRVTSYLLLDMQTGGLRDAATGVEFDSPAITKVRSEVLVKARARQEDAAARMRTACPVGR